MKKHSVLLLISFLFAGYLCAQSSGVATLNYQVSGLQAGDKSVVSLGSDAYLVTQTIITDGDYSFENIPAGEHFIKVEASGYNLPGAQTVIVNANGSIEPVVGIRLAITKMQENSNEWTHSWSEDVSNSGYVTTAYINNPPTIEFLGKPSIESIHLYCQSESLYKNEERRRIGYQ